MMSAGYNDPNFGLPSDSGGSFIGTAICYSPCCIPPEIQPAIPPDGLFGPDTPLHGWGFPGYKPPPDKTSPWHTMPAYPPHRGPRGFEMASQQSAIWDPGDTFDLIKETEWDLPGKPQSYPALTFQGGGWGSATGNSRIPKFEMMSASSGSGGGGGIIGYAKKAANAVVSTVKKGVNAVKGAAKKAYNAVKGAVKKAAAAIGYAAKSISKTVKGAVNGVKSAFNAVKGAVTGWINTVKYTVCAYAELAKIRYDAFIVDYKYKMHLGGEYMADPTAMGDKRMQSIFFYWGALITLLSTFHGGAGNWESWATRCDKVAKHINDELNKNDYKYRDIGVGSEGFYYDSIPYTYHEYVEVTPKNKLHRRIDKGHNIDGWLLPFFGGMYPKR